MKFIMGGRQIELNSLDPKLDDAFIRLHAAYFGNQPFNWADFEEAARDFFDTSHLTSNLHNAFFNNFTVIWNHFLSSGRFDDAENIWDMAIGPALD